MKKIYYLSGPHINVESGYWLFDQLVKDGFSIKSYFLYKYGHHMDFSTRIHKYTRTIKLLLESHKNDLVLLYDVSGVFVLMGILVGLFHLKRHIVAVNFMGSGRKEGYSNWKRPLISFGLKHVKIGVNNLDLIDVYSKQLNIDKKNFFVIKDCAANVDVSDKNCTPNNPPYVFMGGNVRRDWDLFKLLVRQMPTIQFVAALAGNDLDDMIDCKNLKVFKNIPLVDFNELVAHCKIVILPLKTEIQGGQLVAFQGSMYRKPIVITHCMSIDTYYRDDDVIKLEIGDTQSYIKNIQVLLKDENLCKKLGNNGYLRIQKLSPDSIYSMIKKQF